MQKKLEKKSQGLKQKNLLIINQTRIQNTDVIPGKGFHESLQWAKHFGKVIFLCFSDTGQFQSRKFGKNYLLMALPFDLTATVTSSITNLFHNYIGLLKYLYQIITKYHIDLIREENLIIAGIPTLLISKLLRVPYAIWLGGFERKAVDVKYKKSILTRILKLAIIMLEYGILRQAKLVITVSNELQDLTKQRGVTRSVLSPNYVDFSIFPAKTYEKPAVLREKKIKFLYAGRFEEEKGIKILFPALKLVSEKSTKFQMSLVGDGSLRLWIEEFCAKNNLEKQLDIIGKVSFSKMPGYYEAADIFILPSYTEGMSASLSEAMAAGCACICTDVGMSSVLCQTGKNSILIPPGNPAILSEAIWSLLKEPDKIIALGQNGRVAIERYSSKYMNLHIRLYSRILLNK